MYPYLEPVHGVDEVNRLDCPQFDWKSLMLHTVDKAMYRIFLSSVFCLLSSGAAHPRVFVNSRTLGTVQKECSAPVFPVF